MRTTVDLPDSLLKRIKAHMLESKPSLRMLTDSAPNLETVLSLAIKGKVAGPTIHEARIAACCLTHGVSDWRDLRPNAPRHRC